MDINLLYEQLLEKLYSLSRGKSTLDLTNIQALHEAMGFPARRLRTIHVAGTNGKGSVTTKIAHALTLSGYKVGRYTSPHISCFRERICINGCPISKEQLCTYLPSIMRTAETQGIPYSFFEVTTLLGLIFFAEQQVDVAVIETGLGGRLDATNIIHPELCVITSISLDHTALLGNSLEEIAREKGGIIKKSVPVVLGPHANFALLHELARSLQAPVHLSPAINEEPQDYDTENRAISFTALKYLQQTWSIPESSLLEGLKKRPPCRMEEVTNATLGNSTLPSLRSPPHPIILDVAHNPDGIVRLLEALSTHFPAKPIYVLCAFSEDKDLTPMLRPLLRASCGATVSAAPSPRALSAEALLHQARVLFPHKPIEGRASLRDALDHAAGQAAQSGALLLICGTFFMMADIREILGFQEERDPAPLHEMVHKKGLDNTIDIPRCP